MANREPGRNPWVVGGRLGRPPGGLNKRTLLGKSVSETISNMLGFDEAAVERTKMINGKGYAGRLKFEQMINGERPPHPEWLATLKVALSYAYGLPGRMVTDKGPQRPSVLFVALDNQKPWEGENRMDRKSIAMNAAKEQERLMLEADKGKSVAIEAKATGDTSADDLEGGHGFEAVKPEPVDLPGEHGSRG